MTAPYPYTLQQHLHCRFNASYSFLIYLWFGRLIHGYFGRLNDYRDLGVGDVCIPASDDCLLYSLEYCTISMDV